MLKALGIKPSVMHAGMGLSAVQRRQLSIAVGLVAQPRLMFAENPTRGLDAAAALRFVRLVGTLCDGGLAAVCAVNAPRRSIWSLFRSCYVMSCGHVLYAGPCEGAVPWFRSIGYFRGETTGNPADLVLDLVAIDCDKPGVAHTLRTISDVVAAHRQFAATAAPKIEAKAHAFPLAADGNGDVAGSLSFGDDDASPLDGPKRYVASFLAAFPHIFATRSAPSPSARTSTSTATRSSRRSGPSPTRSSPAPRGRPRRRPPRRRRTSRRPTCPTRPSTTRRATCRRWRTRTTSRASSRPRRRRRASATTSATRSTSDRWWWGFKVALRCWLVRPMQ